jgi:hypothetical protein
MYRGISERFEQLFHVAGDASRKIWELVWAEG